MKEISVFDVIGPNMIGPSSSHTAGALKIARIANKLAPAKISKVRFVLYGSFAKTYRGHGTDRALLGGILGFSSEDSKIRNSFAYAQEQGVSYQFEPNETNRDVHPNTVDVYLTCQNGETAYVRGVSTGGGNCRIENIDGIEVDLTGNYPTLLIRQHDVAGVVAYITKCLAQYGVNIAFMRLYRESRGQTAYTIIETDDNLPPELISTVELAPEISYARAIEL